MTDEQKNAVIQMWAEAITKMMIQAEEIKKAMIEIIDHIRPDGFMYMFTTDEMEKLKEIKERLMDSEEAAE